MKRCPQCGARSTDENSFCLDDGTILVSDAAPSGTKPTYELGSDTATRIVSKRTTSSPTQRSPGMYILIGFLVVSLLCTIGYIAVSGERAEITDYGPTGVEKPRATQADPASPKVGAPNSEEVKNSPGKVSDDRNAHPNPNSDALTNAVRQTVLAWAQAGEARDLERTMSFYGDTVAYFRKPSASRSFVRSDKSRYYLAYPSASVSIDNLEITLSPTAGTAEAVFDKTWKYEGGARGSGKVRDQLRLRRDGNRWLIVGEKDLKVHYINK